MECGGPQAADKCLTKCEFEQLVADKLDTYDKFLIPTTGFGSGQMHPFDQQTMLCSAADLNFVSQMQVLSFARLDNLCFDSSRFALPLHNDEDDTVECAHRGERKVAGLLAAKDLLHSDLNREHVHGSITEARKRLRMLGTGGTYQCALLDSLVYYIFADSHDIQAAWECMVAFTVAN